MGGASVIAGHTCDLRDVGDGEPFGVVSRRHQALSHVGRLEVERPLVFVQGLRKSGRRRRSLVKTVCSAAAAVSCFDVLGDTHGHLSLKTCSGRRYGASRFLSSMTWRDQQVRHGTEPCESQGATTPRTATVQLRPTRQAARGAAGSLTLLTCWQKAGLAIIWLRKLRYAATSAMMPQRINMDMFSSLASAMSCRGRQQPQQQQIRVNAGG